MSRNGGRRRSVLSICRSCMYEYRPCIYLWRSGNCDRSGLTDISLTVNETFDLRVISNFSMIRHNVWSNSCHISDNDFIEGSIIMHHFPYVTIGAKSSPSVIDYESSLCRSIPNFKSGSLCIFTSVYGVSTSGSLLCLAICEREKFR